ncbi:diguanylate cyclase [Acetobacterium bakii]|uniref:GGDEF domain-containing protein n=1 Tax=Acetobacterium bakii TaxID=52689 RepID=A0A0L6TZY7_9FIRM|nr:diguanylate cyclase [Acetobacterium bakii]KNZ41821.1 hypothetical protein AKG39_09335 [Acetobacterium bakii]
MKIDEQAIKFIKNLIQLYFSSCDFNEITKKINNGKISLVGTGSDEISMNFNEFKQFVENDRKSWVESSKIIEQWYKAVPVGATGWIVYGELTFKESGFKTPPKEIIFRFSTVCEKTKDGMKLVHAHFSVPNSGDAEHENMHKKLSKDYDLKLEAALKERTELLNQNIEKLRISQLRYEIAMENTDVIIFDYIIATKQSIYPESIGEKYGIHHIVEDTVELVIEKGLVHPKSSAAFREIYKKIDIGEPFAEGVFVFLDKSGNERINEIFFTNIYDKSQKPIRAIGVLRDITEQRKLEAEKEYRKSMTQDKKFAYEANISKDRLTALDLDCSEMAGLPQFYIFSDMIDYMAGMTVHPEYAQLYKNFNSKESIDHLLDSGETKVVIQYPRKDLNADYSWVQNTMCMIQDQLTGDTKIRCYLKNIHEKKQKEKALIYKAEHDSLTGLYNKGTTEMLINQYLTSKEGNSCRHGLFIIDIDYFKAINDCFGHVFGDLVLSEVARKIKEIFRENDIIGRIGGDEFFVLMKNISCREVLIMKGKQLCRELNAMYNKYGTTQNLSVSLGIGLYPDHGMTYEALYHKSDIALYKAKENGRNQFSMCI